MSAPEAKAAAELFRVVMKYHRSVSSTAPAADSLPFARRVVDLLGKSEVSDDEARVWCETLLAAYDEQGLISWAESLTSTVH